MIDTKKSHLIDGDDIQLFHNPSVDYTRVVVMPQNLYEVLAHICHIGDKPLPFDIRRETFHDANRILKVWKYEKQEIHDIEI